MTFELDDPLMLWEDNPDYIELAPPNTDSALSRSLLAIMRPSWIMPPALVGEPEAAQARLGSAEPAPQGRGEFEKWLDASAQIRVLDFATTEISGQQAHRWTLAVDAGRGQTYSCVVGSACASTWVPTSCECRRLQVPLAVGDNVTTIVWIIEQPGADIVIVARAFEAEAEFVATATAIVERLELGEPREQLVAADAVLAVGFPNQAPDASVTFPSVADLQVNLDGRWFDVSKGSLWIGSDPSGFDSYPSGADVHVYGPLFARPDESGGQAKAFRNQTDVVEALRQNDRVGITPVGEATILGRDAELYDLDDAEFLGLSDSAAGSGDIAIEGPQRLWLVDGPNGPWAVFARPESISEAEQLLREPLLTEWQQSQGSVSSTDAPSSGGRRRVRGATFCESGRGPGGISC